MKICLPRNMGIWALIRKNKLEQWFGSSQSQKVIVPESVVENQVSVTKSCELMTANFEPVPEIETKRKTTLSSSEINNGATDNFDVNIQNSSFSISKKRIINGIQNDAKHISPPGS